VGAIALPPSRVQLTACLRLHFSLAAADGHHLHQAISSDRRSRPPLLLLVLDVDVPLAFPPQLRQLDILLAASSESDTPALNATLMNISQLSQLAVLALKCSCSNGVSFAPLLDMSQLREFDVSSMLWLNESQLRGMQQLEVLKPPSDIPLHRLLAPGHSLRVRDIGPIDIFLH
jgi:hypothetical protein